MAASSGCPPVRDGRPSTPVAVNSVRLRWRRPWAEARDDLTARDGNGFFRIYYEIGGPQGGRWFGRPHAPHSSGAATGTSRARRHSRPCALPAGSRSS